MSNELADPHDTTTLTPAAAERIVDGYLTCWNETDRARRAAAIASTWCDDARSVDPLAEATGHAAIDEMIAAVQAQMPGHRFERRGAIAAHHDVVHWPWVMRGADGAHVLTGIDTAVIRDGRIAALAGFFDA
jgi:HEAT repeat protein